MSAGNSGKLPADRPVQRFGHPGTCRVHLLLLVGGYSGETTSAGPSRLAPSANRAMAASFAWMSASHSSYPRAILTRVASLGPSAMKQTDQNSGNCLDRRLLPNDRWKIHSSTYLHRIQYVPRLKPISRQVSQKDEVRHGGIPWSFFRSAQFREFVSMSTKVASVNSLVFKPRMSPGRWRLGRWRRPWWTRSRPVEGTHPGPRRPEGRTAEGLVAAFLAKTQQKNWSDCPRGIGELKWGSSSESWRQRTPSRLAEAASAPGRAHAGGTQLPDYGGKFQPTGSGPRLLTQCSAPGQQFHRQTAGPVGLTPREVEILGMLCHGMAPAEISASLFLSRTTVHHHVEHIYTKLGATNRVGATLFEVGPQPPEPGPLDTTASTRSTSTARRGSTPSGRHRRGWR